MASESVVAPPGGTLCSVRCPVCASLDDKVVDSRTNEDGSAIRRRRECLSCGRRFTTFERLDEEPVLVVKRSGDRVPFDRERITVGVEAAAKGRDTQPLAEVFRPPLLRSTLLGIVFASVALIGTWGSVQWIPVWVDKMAGATDPGAKAVAQMASAWGAILGCLLGPLAGGKAGRRPAYFGLCLASLVVTQFLFRSFDSYTAGLVVTVFLAGACTAAFYGWFPLYLPELFPTRARATGQGVAYNSGRVFAAFGALFAGQLVRVFDGSYARMGTVITLVYVVGMLVIWLAPETKGRILPD